MGEVLDLSAWPNVQFDQWPPGTVFTAVEGIDPGSADENACMGVSVACRRLIRRLQAIDAAALARSTDLAESERSSASSSEPSASSDSPNRAYELIDAVDLVAAEVALALALSRHEANAAVSEAVEVTRDLPLLTAQVRDGLLDWEMATRVHHRMTIRGLQPGTENWQRAEAIFAIRLPGKTWEAASSVISRLLRKIAPRAAVERERKAQQSCFLRISPLADGMARIEGRLRADDARLIDANLDANADAARDHARANGIDDQRNHQQRRVGYLVSVFRSIMYGNPLRRVTTPAPASAAAPSQDSQMPGHADFDNTATADIDDATAEQTEPAANTDQARRAQPPASSRDVLAWWDPPPPPTRSGHRPHLNLTMTLDALLELTDEPGLLRRHGYISADLARDIARQAKKVTITLIPGPPGKSPSSRAATHGPGDQANCTDTTRPYRPRPTVVDSVLGRFTTCTHPGCTTDAYACDIDHVIPYLKGGFSCSCNLVPLCRFHHRLKTHGQWSTRLTRPDEPYPPGTIEYISRLGQRHIELPPHLPGMPDPDDHPDLVDHPDPTERSRRRESAWQKELHFIDPTTRPGYQPSSPAEADPGEPPF